MIIHQNIVTRNNIWKKSGDMLKSIATARSECTAKHKKKASYNVDYLVPNLIDFLGDDCKEIKRQTEKRNIHNRKKYHRSENWFVVSNF